MKIWKNLKWLFNSPPIHIKADVPEGTRCDYCGIGPFPNSEDTSLWKTSDYCICEKCRKKVFDSVLNK